MEPQKKHITWEVVTHVHRERSADWYWAVGVGTVVAAAASIYFQNYLLAFILIIGMGSIAVLSARGPREHTVRIDRRGVSLDGTFYPFANVHSFWVDVAEDEDGTAHDGYRPHLFLTTGALVMPHVMIPLDNAAHALEVRDHLREFLPEEPQTPQFSENIAEILGF